MSIITDHKALFPPLGQFPAQYLGGGPDTSLNSQVKIQGQNGLPSQVHRRNPTWMWAGDSALSLTPSNSSKLWGGARLVALVKEKSLLEKVLAAGAPGRGYSVSTKCGVGNKHNPCWGERKGDDDKQENPQVFCQDASENLSSPSSNLTL